MNLLLRGLLAVALAISAALLAVQIGLRLSAPASSQTTSSAAPRSQTDDKVHPTPDPKSAGSGPRRLNEREIDAMIAPIVRDGSQQLAPPGAVELLHDPEFARAMAWDVRTLQASLHRRLFQQLQLDDQALDRLRTLLAEKYLATADTALAAAGGLDSMAGFERTVDEARNRSDDAIARLLGPEKFRACEQFEESLPFRNQAQALATKLQYTDAPMSDSDVDTLTGTLAGAASATMTAAEQRGLKMSGYSQVYRPPLTGAQLAAAEHVLSPAQYTALVQLAQDQQGAPSGIVQWKKIGRRIRGH